MKIHQLVQGTPEWHAHRATHFNASDAPAMMGCSPYKTRQQFLHERATGIAADVDAATQRRFDDGHRFEALARPLAEKLIGDELYPLTGSEGALSASFDGLTLMNEVAFEHKTLSAALADVLHADCKGFELPLQYRVQMEQQCMVSGAQRVLFMASKWNGETLIEERHCWYKPDPELAAQIRAGWAQFEADLAAYVPPDVVAPVVAAPQEHLPAVSVQLQGALAVVSNLQPFGEALRAFVAKIPKKPTTDQEFADTEAACKRLKAAEDMLQSAEDNALASMADVEAMRRTVAELRELARTTRLLSERTVKARKEQIRSDEVARGHSAIAEHIAALHRRLGGAYISGLKRGDFGSAIKGLKSLDSLRNAIDTEVAAAKIEANQMADAIDANLKAINEAGAPHLFNDLRTLVLKQADDLAAVIAQRLAAEQQRQEAERERIRQQEAARVEREHQAQLQRERDAQAAAERAAAEAAAKAAAPAPAPEPVAALAVAPAVARASAPLPPAPAANEAPTLKLGQINERLGFMVGVDLLSRLGFPATAQGASRLYRESDFPRICAALAAHVQSVCMVEAA